jgi:SAM-dependent methyltransferase
MSIRTAALKTQPRQQHRVPARAISKSTQRYRRLVEERWSVERLANRRLKMSQSRRVQRREETAALALLALTNKAQHDQVVAAKRQRQNREQQARRARNKRPTPWQAIKLLEKLEAEVPTPQAAAAKKEIKNNKSLKFGRLLAPMVLDLIARLALQKGKLFVDIGSGTGVVCFLIALITGANVVAIEIRRELHEMAVLIGHRLEAECTKRGWLGVGKWTLLCGDALEVMLDESAVPRNIIDDDRINAVSVNGIVRNIPKCFYSLADYLLLNNWAFDDTFTLECLRQYGRLAPVDGQAVFIRNPLPRYRPGSRIVGSDAFVLYELPTLDTLVYDVPAGGVDWRSADGVQWTAVRVLPLGVRQSTRQPAARFVNMSRSILP